MSRGTGQPNVAPGGRRLPLSPQKIILLIGLGGMGCLALSVVALFGVLAIADKFFSDEVSPLESWMCQMLPAEDLEKATGGTVSYDEDISSGDCRYVVTGSKVGHDMKIIARSPTTDPKIVEQITAYLKKTIEYKNVRSVSGVGDVAGFSYNFDQSAAELEFIGQNAAFTLLLQGGDERTYGDAEIEVAAAAARTILANAPEHL
ncbi:hypothetical protein [Kineosporia babensis]|uniref:Uncharacterized protein n=1 Tax=Kineosporia babensis TaxID=499548 RepID=A0A9X1SU52_9ACTN|nr:hypothetical protein [Kineosporia babensis]MCD5312071.1 hypothetical protein [Kineosporia babensis]